MYPPAGSPHLLELISRAGGVTPLASKTVLVFHRNAPKQPVKVQLSDTTEDAVAANIELQPGDTVVVAKAGVVYVIGDVARPGGFVMDSESLSVLQALALAAGPNRTAKLDQTRIIRKTPAGIEDIPLQLTKVIHSKETDVVLRAGDIVYVPSSMAKNAVRISAQSILQSVLTMGMYTAVR